MVSALRAHVFADFDGYSRLISRRGERDVAKVMTSYGRIVRANLAPSNIDIEQIGDTFHLVFQLPADAVHSAIEIADALHRHNRKATERIPVKFGVEAGQSVRRGQQYVGPAPVLASALCHRAQSGQILVGEAARNLIRTADIPLRDLGDWKPPGGTTVHIYEARAPDEVADSTAAGLTARSLFAFLFTDIVGSTAAAAAAGDRRWRNVVERHHAIIREELQHYRGTEIDTAGDGFYATFDSPSRAILCALAAGERLRVLGVDIRAGVHIGDCEIVAGKIGGLAVSIGARIRDKAGPGEVLVSETVKGALVGAGFEFAAHSRQRLKGAPGEWELHSVRLPSP